MKKNYLTPDLSVVVLTTDVIITSAIDDNPFASNVGGGSGGVFSDSEQ